HWIREGTADAIVAARREEARERQSLARERLSGFDFDSHPEGYYLWLRLPEPWRGESFAAEARARGALVTPAEAVPGGRGRPPDAGRVCVGAAGSGGTLARGLDTVAALLRDGGATGRAVV